MNSPAEEGSLVSLEDQSGSARSASYRVLARKYRPSTFDDLIGQEALVRTISNAFEAGRIPQAWILTGVRGVGKTTTARILARALNYEFPGRVSGPSIQMPELGLHCQAIMDSRHIDVIEMDAASHNGVDDVRQINDAVRYAPVMARTKVYILDEVHMLSGAAFNALLKTLEEPPPHAKFIFATTEIRKVPVTVLSRCQRFDLRRVEASVLVKHLEMICAKESVSAEPEALAVIARASEGSVRDSLSLLDQAIAHAAGPINAEDVHRMLGLADRTRIVGLFEALMQGNVAHALAELRDQYESGADPSVLLSELAEFTHFVTRVKIIPAVAEDPALVEVERVKGREFAAKLSVRILSRAWQILFKGLAEVQAAARPVAAAEMVLIRLAYAADLPTPDEVIRQLDGGTASRPAPAARPARDESAPTRAPLRSAIGGSASPSPAPNEAIETQSLTPFGFEDVVALAAEKRDLNLKRALESDVRLVRCENGRLELALEPGAERSLIHDLSRKLSEWTGRRWMVIVSAEAGGPTLKAAADAERASLMHGIQADPTIQAVLARFPGARIVDVRNRGGTALDANAPYGSSDAKKFTDQSFTDQNFTGNGEGIGEDET